MSARIRLAEAAIVRIEELDGEDWVRDDTLERVRGLYDYRRRRFGAIEDGDGEQYEERSGAYIRLMYELFDAQREELIGMRNRRRDLRRGAAAGGARAGPRGVAAAVACGRASQIRRAPVRLAAYSRAAASSAR